MATDRTQDLDSQIAKVRAWFSGDLALAAKNLATGETILVDADRLLPTASVFKIPVMVEVFRQAETGAYSLDDRIEFDPEAVVHGSGVLRDIAPGLTPTIHDLTMLMIIVSDNTATNMLIDRVGGVGPINDTLRTLGLTATTVHREIDFSVLSDDNRAAAEATPSELMSLIERMATGTLVSAEASAAMLAIMGRQHYLNQVPRYFDYNPYGPELNDPQSIWIGCKTGALPGMRADSGLIRLPGDIEVAYCAMNANSRDTGFTYDNESEIANGLLGAILLRHWWPEDAAVPLPLVDSPYLDSVLSETT